MFNITRSVLAQAKPASSLLTKASQNIVGNVYPVNGRVRSHQASTSGGSPTSMDKIQHSQEPNQKGDVMSPQPLADGYSTRPDEECFGGSFTGNDSLSSKDQEKIVYANAPEYDTPQGSESAEKGKGGNQT